MAFVCIATADLRCEISGFQEAQMLAQGCCRVRKGLKAGDPLPAIIQVTLQDHIHRGFRWRCRGCYPCHEPP
ncbi:hypothetical protein B0W47_07730 [Komagataeibacter nataicola]|uniref:Uncharacterized protein n=1 Tax=Komagataeibacter nataicola TaxID=265960 RepID=A0A9N7CMS5_9PROT|nr:hypothetical protein B0W47_07730 [Komagataeibacter nataicola]